MHRVAQDHTHIDIRPIVTKRTHYPRVRLHIGGDIFYLETQEALDMADRLVDAAEKNNQ